MRTRFLTILVKLNIVTFSRALQDVHPKKVIDFAAILTPPAGFHIFRSSHIHVIVANSALLLDFIISVSSQLAVAKRWFSLVLPATLIYQLPH